MKKIILILLVISLPLIGQDITNKIGASGNYDITDSSDNVLVRVEDNGEIGIGTESPDANLDVHGSVKMFDDYKVRSDHTVYTADTDGFVVAYATIIGFSESEIEGFVGPSSSGPITGSPSTLIVKSKHNEGIINFTMPVQKGLSWLVDANGIFSSINVYWIELGQ